jgi:hypothetical protein
MGLAGHGAAWLKSQSADLIDRMLQNWRRHPLPPSGVAPLGSLFRSAGVVHFARLVATRHQAELGADVARPTKALGIIDSGREG